MAAASPVPVRLTDGRLLSIRAPLPKDAEELIRFQREIAYGGGLVPEPEEAVIDLETQRMALEEGRDGAGLHLAAFEGDRAAGTTTLYVVSLKKLQHVAELGLAVAPIYRRLGIGRQLLAAALDRGRERRLLKIVARVFADNAPALALYASLGFVEEGRQLRQYRFADGTLADGVLLARFL